MDGRGHLPLPRQNEAKLPLADPFLPVTGATPGVYTQLRGCVEEQGGAVARGTYVTTSVISLLSVTLSGPLVHSPSCSPYSQIRSQQWFTNTLSSLNAPNDPKLISY